MRSTGVRREESRIYLDGPTENIETIDHFFHSQHPRLLCSDEEILCPRQGTIMLSATLSLKGEINLIIAPPGTEIITLAVTRNFSTYYHGMDKGKVIPPPFI